MALSLGACSGEVTISCNNKGGAESILSCGEDPVEDPIEEERVGEPESLPDIFESVSLVPQSDGGLFLENDASEGYTMIARTFSQFVFEWTGTQQELDDYEAATDASEIAELRGNRNNYDTDPDSPGYVDIDALIQEQRDVTRYTPEFRHKSFRQDWIDAGYELVDIEVKILVIREVYAVSSPELRKAELAAATYQVMAHHFNHEDNYTGDSNLFESNNTVDGLLDILRTGAEDNIALNQILERCQSLLSELDALFIEEEGN